ncbi:Nonribosomal peptide synthetase [Lachnellula hyalina]|uniref:Nonribosomal peptide synthetase n=1 Tax=Lachnellula hyalina TaxID=1316788 RepID=A0A8H8TZP5_9HELO|nr:Nonribosomal peptide synthetase [Lachnellula hyalina]TVY28404.1 Nonribosomal peptide synthetase [Lachnellula hyalina]
MAICSLEIDSAKTFVDYCQALANSDGKVSKVEMASSVQQKDMPFNSITTLRQTVKNEVLQPFDQFVRLLENFKEVIYLAQSTLRSTIDSMHQNGITVEFDNGNEDISFQVTSYKLPSIQINRLASSIETTLVAVSEFSGKAVGEVSIVSPQDLDELWKWNAYLPPAPATTIYEIFQAQVMSTPDGEAVSSWDGSFSYSQLEAYASKLAVKLLEKLPSGPTIVPVCFEKSKWTIVAMLAVLKAGYAFATLDPSQPTNRLEAMMLEVDARVIIASTTQIGRFNIPDLHMVTNIEDICHSTEDVSELEFHVLAPDDLAYVLFTSGSTGKPKAVLHPHTAACSKMLSENEPGDSSYGYGPGGRILQFASQAFGASVYEVLKTLGQGGCICIPSEEQRLQHLVKFINDQKITRTFLVPTVLKLLSPEDVPTLEILTIGGEPVSPDLVKIWCGKLRLIEAFGMTEGVTVQTEIDSNGQRTRQGQHLGAAAWIVDPSNYHKLTPIGGIGELLFEGPCLSTGYLGDQEKTDNAFVKNPDWMRAGRPQRLFRTGDLGQYDYQGVIKILGRKDTRVKLRGQRIELGEVESQIQKHLTPDCWVAVEVITSKESGDAMLVGFVGHSKSPDSLKMHKERP